MTGSSQNHRRSNLSSVAHGFARVYSFVVLLSSVTQVGEAGSIFTYRFANGYGLPYVISGRACLGSSDQSIALLNQLVQTSDTGIFHFKFTLFR
ncbi:hypothetical protein SEGD1_074 [Enterobacteria phage SEGD1]|uniref:Uncharacterized protein n=1 Tax=Enterobacteria phage SEGD1 TaxID=1805456 RepID=A0A142IID5_9CAUD|nr:hypothetical protein SEGD1_074 [Enterobacteria phage SEGD1]MIP73431.1 hypothetical protein [Salmonella enterica subsp. enterica]